MLRRRRVFSLLPSGLIVAAGCLSGEYDKEFAASLDRHRQEAAFQQLVPAAQEIAGGRLMIRPPRALKDQDDGCVQPWAKPPFLATLPGFTVAYGLAMAEEPKVHATLSVAVPTDKDSGLEDLKKSILQQVQTAPAFAKAKPSWAPAEGLPGGGPQWSVLSLPGKQPFVHVKDDKPATTDLEGETQIWLAADTATKAAAILVWRVPQAAAGGVALNELAPLVARKVEFRAVAEPAAAAQSAAQ
ncbi:MAG: hypothetical protein RLZZ111_1525 [Planctomycetota bacterium]|jgi:hypothetical protein